MIYVAQQKYFNVLNILQESLVWILNDSTSLLGQLIATATQSYALHILYSS